MRADGVGGAGGGEWRVRDVEGGLGGVAQQPGPGVAAEDLALDPDDGGDMGVPICIGQPVIGIEDGDGAALVAVAARVAAVCGPERRRGGRNLLDALMQGRLVVLDPDDQGDAAGRSDLEMFFWQCSASRVTMAPRARPRSASSACAAGISLDFSAMST
jgi:hypothetical protein